MISTLKPYALKELKNFSEPKCWFFQEKLEEFPSLIPIEGKISAEHQGNFLAVKANFKTIVNLTCDRCLKSYNHKLKYEGEELIWIKQKQCSSSISERQDYLDDNLIEFIEPNSSFDPRSWIYDQLNLQMPLLNVCGELCLGHLEITNALQKNNLGSNSSSNSGIDPRWSSLLPLLENE